MQSSQTRTKNGNHTSSHRRIYKSHWDIRAQLVPAFDQYRCQRSAQVLCGPGDNRALPAPQHTQQRAHGHRDRRGDAVLLGLAGGAIASFAEARGWLVNQARMADSQPPISLGRMFTIARWWVIGIVIGTLCLVPSCLVSFTTYSRFE
jgi:hypothetical protein